MQAPLIDSSLTTSIIYRTSPYSCTACATSGTTTTRSTVIIVFRRWSLSLRASIDGIPVLQSLQLPYVRAQGYVNLRCGWTLGCPSEIRPHGDGGPVTSKYYEQGFKALFPNTAVPQVVGVGCCAQFAVTREKLLERPKEDYERYRQWLLETPLEDYVSGRIMEYSWHSKSRSTYQIFVLSFNPLGALCFGCNGR